ncbi:MAG: hypothetical protein SGJ17_06750 [Hyphomicrobiales bacterium]|nr:hypothetical protein [Hyphomicrobiales bacterium]
MTAARKVGMESSARSSTGSAVRLACQTYSAIAAAPASVIAMEICQGNQVLAEHGEPEHEAGQGHGG